AERSVREDRGDCLKVRYGNVVTGSGEPASHLDDGISSAREGDNMIKTTPEQNKTLVLQAFDTLFNIGTTRRPSGTGHRTTFNTARTSRLGATACSIWSGARHRR